MRRSPGLTAGAFFYFTSIMVSFSLPSGSLTIITLRIDRHLTAE